MNPLSSDDAGSRETERNDFNGPTDRLCSTDPNEAADAQLQAEGAALGRRTGVVYEPRSLGDSRTINLGGISAKIPQASDSARQVVGDALLYTCSAGFALCLFRVSPFVKYRAWAMFAAPTYAAAGLVMIAYAISCNRSSQRALARVRVAVVFAALVGALAVPLAFEVSWRVERGPQYAPSEVVITEVAARSLVHGRNPYAARLASPELAGRQASISQHFPYLLGMTIFGLPRVLLPRTRWGDARVWSALLTLVATALALWRWKVSYGLRLRLLQVLLVPVGSAVLVAGGNDVPVLAFCLCALVLFQRGKQKSSATAIAVAALLKLTAWPLFATLTLASQTAPGKRRRAFAFASIIVVGCVLGCVAAGPTVFVDDVLLFPFGLTSLRSPAATSTLGSTLVNDLTSRRMSAVHVATALIVIMIGLAICAVLLSSFARRNRKRPPGSPEIAVTAGAMVAALILFAPQARLGYVIYPLDLFAWATFLRPRPAALVRLPATSVPGDPREQHA